MNFFTRPSVAILAVCTANICRSPMAEGLLRAELKLRGLAHRVNLDSAGTRVAQVGQIADRRAQLVCAREGIDLRKTRARQVIKGDFLRFDYILAMDQRNQQWLLDSCPDSHRERITLMGAWATEGLIDDIPDPYFGSVRGFEEVLQKLHQSVDGFLEHFVEELRLSGE